MKTGARRKAQGSDPDRACASRLVPSDLVLRHVRFAERIAGQMGHACGREMRRDVRSAALLGLVEAATRFDPARGVEFRTFAYWRIRGAVHDQFRRMGLVRPGALAEVRRALQGESPVVSLETVPEPRATDHDSGTCLEVEELLGLAALDPRELRVLRSIYVFGEDDQDAGRAEGWSKSWTSRRHRAALVKLQEAGGRNE